MNQVEILAHSKRRRTCIPSHATWNIGTKTTNSPVNTVKDISNGPTAVVSSGIRWSKKKKTNFLLLMWRIRWSRLSISWKDSLIQKNKKKNNKERFQRDALLSPLAEVESQSVAVALPNTDAPLDPLVTSVLTLKKKRNGYRSLLYNRYHISMISFYLSLSNFLTFRMHFRESTDGQTAAPSGPNLLQSQDLSIVFGLSYTQDSGSMEISQEQTKSTGFK